MLRLAVVADNRSDDWCSRLAARFTDVAIGRLEDSFPGIVSDSGQAISETWKRFDAVWLLSSKLALDISLNAARAGKHLMVDARAVVNNENLEVLCEAVAAGGGQCVMASSLRFLPSVQVVKEQLDSGKLGDPGLLRIHDWRAADHASSANALAAGLIGQIDLACWLFRSLPTYVFARKGTMQAAGQSPDYVQLHLGFSGGGMALIDNWRRTQTGPGYFSLSLIGSSGAAYADDHHNMQLLLHDGPLTALRTDQDAHAARNQIEELLAAIREQRDPRCGFDRARQLQSVAAAAAESLESDQSVLMESRKV